MADIFLFLAMNDAPSIFNPDEESEEQINYLKKAISPFFLIPARGCFGSPGAQLNLGLRTGSHHM